MRTSFDAFYHKKNTFPLYPKVGESMVVPHELLVRKDQKIHVENSKKILEGQRPIRVYFEDFRKFVKEI